MTNPNYSTLTPEMKNALRRDYFTADYGYDVEAYFADCSQGYWTPAYETLINAQLDWMERQNVKRHSDAPRAARLARFAVSVVALLMSLAAFWGALAIAAMV